MEYRILGLSTDTFAVVADVLTESYGQLSFVVHLNKDFGVTPSVPLQQVDYMIKPFTKELLSDVLYVFGAASPKNKQAIFLDFKAENNVSTRCYARVIHPRAYVSNSSLLLPGVFIEPGAIISAQSRVEFGVSIKRGALIGHHNTIGAFTDINPGAVVSGKVSIGAGCIIGSGAVIKDNITIGKHTVIGAGSVVTKNIPEGVIAFGNPCKVVKENE